MPIQLLCMLAVRNYLKAGFICSAQAKEAVREIRYVVFHETVCVRVRVRVRVCACIYMCNMCMCMVAMNVHLFMFL